MGTFVLILIITTGGFRTGGGADIEKIEFSSKDLCVAAMNEVKSYVTGAVCVKSE